MDVDSVDRLTCEGLGRSWGDGDVRSSEELEHLQGVYVRQLEADVADHGGNALDFELGGAEGQQQCQGVVDSRIGIYQHVLHLLNSQ